MRAVLRRGLTDGLTRAALVLAFPVAWKLGMLVASLTGSGVTTFTTR